MIGPLEIVLIAAEKEREEDKMEFELELRKLEQVICHLNGLFYNLYNEKNAPNARVSVEPSTGKFVRRPLFCDPLNPSEDGFYTMHVLLCKHDDPKLKFNGTFTNKQNCQLILSMDLLKRFIKGKETFSSTVKEIMKPLGYDSFIAEKLDEIMDMFYSEYK
jgi:hypothetical protein